MVQVDEAQKGKQKEIKEKLFEESDERADLIGKSIRTVRRYKAQSLYQTTRPYFRFIDLFAGIGGLRIPFEEIGGKCVFTSELDRFARQTYAANFPDTQEHEFAGDIRPYANSPYRIPEHDVLLAGFPCQPFSIAGVSSNNSLGRPHGFKYKIQGTLFYDITKIIKYHRPAVVFLENVKNLEHHNDGRTFQTIKHVIGKELGYEFHKRVISSHTWVPQKRERIFIVAFKNSSSFNFDEFTPPTETNSPVLGDILDTDIPDKYTLTDRLWAYLQNYKKKHQKAGNGFGFSLFNNNSITRTLSARYYKDGSEILIDQGKKNPRKLTPRECSRLMGFDAPQGSEFIIPVSDTQAYRQFGNAVVVPVVRAVAQSLKPHLEEAVAVNDTCLFN